MISLTLSVCLSVCLPIYLSINFICRSVRLCFATPSVILHTDRTSIRTLLSPALSTCLSAFLSFSFFVSSPSFFPSVFLPCFSSFSSPFYFFLFFSFSFSTYSPSCVETVTLLEPKRWSFYSSQCSSRFNFYSTVVLSLIKIPTKKSKTRYRKKNNTYPDTLFNFLLNNRLDLIGILFGIIPSCVFHDDKKR